MSEAAAFTAAMAKVAALEDAREQGYDRAVADVKRWMDAAIQGRDQRAAETYNAVHERLRHRAFMRREARTRDQQVKWRPMTEWAVFKPSAEREVEYLYDDGEISDKRERIRLIGDPPPVVEDLGAYKGVDLEYERQFPIAWR